MNPDRSGRLTWAATLLIPLGFIHLLLFVRIPLDVYLASAAEHSSTVTELFGLLAGLGLVSLFAVTMLAAVAGRRIAGDLRGWLIALALTVWVIDSFMGRAYPLLDGTEPHLQPERLKLVLEIAVLMALVAALARWRTLEMPALLFLTLLLIFNLWSALAGIVAHHAEHPSTGAAEPAPGDESPFALSSEHSVLVVLMDTFQSDFLEDVFAREPGLGDAFDGFVWFPDTLGVAPTTFLSLPAIHSGRPYDPRQPMSAYFNTAIREQSFLAELSGSGWRSVLVNPILDLCPLRTLCVSREDLLRTRRETALREALHLLDIAALRIAPEAAKDGYFNGGQFRLGTWFVSGQLAGAARLVWDDTLVLEQAGERLSGDADRPTALFIHLLNTHPPYVLDADCTVAEKGRRPNRLGAVEQATCAIRQFTGLLDELRNAGLYDPTMIVLAGDHGYASASGASDLDHAHWPQGAHPEISGRIAGSANPLLLVKRPHARGPLSRSSREASLTEVAATVCGVTGGCRTSEGSGLFDPPARGDRTRSYLSYTWEHRFWDLGYIPEVVSFEVNGPLSRPESWSQQPLGLRRERVESLSADGTGTHLFFDEGWDEAESDGAGVSWRWALAQRASLLARLDTGADPPDAYQFDLKLLAPAQLDGQAVTISVNGIEQIRRPLDPHVQMVSFRVPAALVRPGYNRLELAFAGIAAPHGEDGRKLAASLFSVTLSEVRHSGE